MAVPPASSSRLEPRGVRLAVLNLSQTGNEKDGMSPLSMPHFNRTADLRYSTAELEGLLNPFKSPTHSGSPADERGRVYLSSLLQFDRSFRVWGNDSINALSTVKRHL